MISPSSFDPNKPFQIVPSLKSNIFLLIKRLTIKNQGLVKTYDSILSAEKSKSATKEFQYIAPIVDYVIHEKNLFVMSESVSSLSLNDFLKKQPNLSEKESIKIIQCIISGVEELRKAQPDTIHGNLNKNNIFVLTDIDDEFICKLTDYHKIIKITGNLQNSYSIAPELLERKSCFLSENLINIDFEKNYPKADVWSIGWLFYELLFGKEIWDYTDLKKMVEFITSDDNSSFFNNAKGISENALNLLHNSLIYHPEHRISWIELLEHPLFKDMRAGEEKLEHKNSMIIKVDLYKFDLNLKKEENYSQYKFEIKGLEEVFPNELLIRQYSNEFNLINKGYEFEILDAFLIFSDANDFNPLQGKVCYKVYDKINQKNFIIRIFKVETENYAFPSFLKDCCFEYVLSKIHSKIGLNMLTIYEVFLNNLDCIDYFGNYLIFLYDDFNFFLEDLFENLTEKTIELNLSQKLMVFLAICKEFNRLKQSNFDKIQAIQSQNVVFYKNKLTNKISIKLAFFNDVNAQKPPFDMESPMLSERNFERKWQTAVFYLGTFFYQILSHRKFYNKIKSTNALQDMMLEKFLLDLFEIMTSDDLEKRTSLENLIQVLEESSLIHDKNLDFLKNLQRSKCKIDEKIIKRSFTDIYEILFHFKKAAQLFEKFIENEKPSENTIEILAKIAMNYHNDVDADKANVICYKALTLLKSDIIKGDKLDLQITKYRLNLVNGISLMALGLPDKSTTYLEAAYKIGEKIKSFYPYAQSACIKFLCDNLKIIDKTSKALGVNEKSLEILKKIKENSPFKRKLMIEFLLNFSQTYLMMGNFPKAVEFCNDALIYHERHFPEYHPFLKQCYVCMGNLNFIQGLFDKAINNFEYALNVNSKIFPPDHETFIDLNYDLGTVYSKTDASPSNYLKFFEQALESSLKNGNTKKSAKEKKEQLSLINSSIARAHYGLNKFDQAIEYFQKALNIDKELYLELNNLRIVEEYLLLGNSYSCLSNYDAALRNCEEALKIGEKLLPETDEKMVDILFDLGDICNNLKKVEEGVGYYERIIKIYEKNKKLNNDNKIFEVFMAISNLYMSLGNFEQAIKALVAGQQKYKMINKGEYNDPIIINVLNSIGALYSSSNSLDKAIKTYLESLDIAKKHFTNEEKLILDALIGLAISYFNMEDFEKAIKYFLEALEIKENKKEKGANVGDLCSNLGYAYKSLKNHEDAKKYIQKAVDYYQESLPKNHKDLISAVEMLNSLS